MGHPNVTFVTYKAPYTEAHLRGTMNGMHDEDTFRGSPMKAVLMTFFDVKAYSDAMLTDASAFQQVQVRFLPHQAIVSSFSCYTLSSTLIIL